MGMYIKIVCAAFILKLVACEVFLLDLSRLEGNGEPILTKIIGRQSGLRRGDIFESFIRNMLDVLTTNFPGKRLRKYCELVEDELDRLEFKYTRKLAKHFRHLSKMDGDAIKAEMDSYRQELDKKPPNLVAFLEAMNEAVRLELSVLFNDYALDVRDYGTRDKRDVKEETRSVLNAIVKSVKELSARDRRDLEKKMKKVIKEHQGEDLNVSNFHDWLTNKAFSYVT